MSILIGKVRDRSLPAPPKLCKTTAEATGFSERTVNHVLLEKRMLDEALLDFQIRDIRKAENM